MSDAQAGTHRRLDEELESYLVFLLMRFSRDSKVVLSVLALDYLESDQATGQVRSERLREVRFPRGRPLRV